MVHSSSINDELHRLEKSLREALKPVHPRPEYMGTVRSHLDAAEPFIKRRLRAVRAARIAVLSVVGLFGGIIVLISGFKLIARFQARLT